jgi:hypothetical protein
MERLHIQLLLRLDRYKTHPRPSDRFGNRFRVDVVALVGLHIRLYVLRRHQAHFMPLFPQSPPEKVRSTAGFHADPLNF